MLVVSSKDSARTNGRMTYMVAHRQLLLGRYRTKRKKRLKRDHAGAEKIRATSPVARQGFPSGSEPGQMFRTPRPDQQDRAS